MLQPITRRPQLSAISTAPALKVPSGIAPGPQLTVIVPTRNEHGNVRPVYHALCRALQGIDWEVIFVDDDSRDGTPETVCRLASYDRRPRCIHRIRPRRLPSACRPGLLA